MTPSSAGSTLLDRMVARVAEPPLAIPFALTTPSAWGEEISEPVVPQPARVPESKRPEPVMQPAQAAQDVAPPIAPRVREMPFAESVARPVVQPVFPTLQSAPQAHQKPTEPMVEAAPRMEVMLHETTVLVPAPSLHVPSREAHTVAPKKLQLDFVLPLRHAPAEEMDSPTTAPVPARKRTAPPVVQPDLPVSLPMRESAPQAAVPSESVIHVTIGRLEVRAPERERKPRTAERGPAHAGPSLEQYLAKRRGGGPA
jgi:hypothetical protein